MEALRLHNVGVDRLSGRFSDGGDVMYWRFMVVTVEAGWT